MLILCYLLNFIFLDSYEQGLKRIKYAFSNVVVHSSNIDDNDDLRQYLNTFFSNAFGSFWNKYWLFNN